MRTGLVFALMFILKILLNLRSDYTNVLFVLLFNPLQELGNVIATYNETKASMDNFGD
jgi:ATP-binding cassette subfamily B protein